MSQPSFVFNNLCLAGHAESASMNNETVCLHVVLEIVNVQVWKRTSYYVNFEALRQLLKTTCTKCSLLYSVLHVFPPSLLFVSFPVGVHQFPILKTLVRFC